MSKLSYMGYIVKMEIKMAPGMTFNRLTLVELVIRFRNNSGWRELFWKCNCDCGGSCVIRQSQIISGRAKSCGCLRKETTIANGKKRRKFGVLCKEIPEWWIWQGMLSRTQPDSSCEFYAGMEVEETWRTSFAAFYDHIGPRPTPYHSIDRIDGSRGYLSGNVRWATQEEQMGNVCYNINVTIGGRTQCVARWCDETGINYGTAISRIGRDVPPEQAVQSPVKDRRIEWDGKKLTIPNWANITGIPKHTIRARIKKGWSIERVLTQPLDTRTHFRRKQPQPGLQKPLRARTGRSKTS